jgi:hypothetical protein
MPNLTRKITCPYCVRPFNVLGLGTHRKRCREKWLERRNRSAAKSQEPK